MKQLLGLIRAGHMMVASLMLSAVLAAHAAPLNKIVVFGDSLSDTGNLYEYMNHQLPISPPYYKGRFCNGPLWIESLVEHYFPHNPKSAVLNYAFGGSAVSNQQDDNDADAGVLSSLRLEIDSYLLAHQDKADPDSLMIVFMGSNNYLGLPDDPDAAVDDAIMGIQSSLGKLLAKGAKHMLLISIPDLGLTPVARDFEAVELLSYISNQHNQKLQLLEEEMARVNPEVQWLYFDVNRVFQEILAHPTKYGFTNTTDTCYDALLPNNESSSQTLIKMAKSVRRSSALQADACHGYLFFDPVHPTVAAHQLMTTMLIELFNMQGIEFQHS